MKGTLAIILATSLSAISHTALAVNPTAETTELNCGSFQAKATTESASSTVDDYRQGLSQTIRLINRPRHIAVDLDLQQHKSPAPELDGRLALDGLAAYWRCVHSSLGQDYLLVDFSCVNEGATTCTTAMDIPGAEWRQIFDASGHPLVPGHDASKTARLKKLGLLTEFMSYATDELPVYDNLSRH